MSQHGTRSNAILVNDTSVDHHWGCVRVIRTIRALTERNGINISTSIPAHTDWRDPKYLKRIESADLIIVNGEGTLHSDKPQAHRLLDIGAYAKSLGIPAVLINSSWQRNSGEMARKLANFEIFATRDSFSAADAGTAGIKATVVPDLSLYFDDCIAQQRSGVGVTDSVVPHIRVELERKRLQWHASCVPIHFSEKGLVGVYRFFRRSLSRRYMSNWSGMAGALRFRYLQFINQCKTELEYLRLTSRLELIVSARFHSAAIALNERTPVIAVLPRAADLETDGNKLRGLIVDSGLERWRMADVESVDQYLLNEASNWHGNEAKCLDDFLVEGRTRTDNLFKMIACIV